MRHLAATTALSVCSALLVVTFAQAPRESAPPQSQASQPAPFQTRVDLVTVDVSVLDRDRRPVRGLTAADFTVLEDGRPQPIQTFSAIDIPDLEEVPAAWARDVGPDVRRNDDLADRRIVTIVLDDALPMQAPVVPRAREAAGVVVDRLGPRDLAAVVFPLAKNGGQDYTSDRARLRKAIDRYGGGTLADDGLGGPIRTRFLYDSMISTVRMVTEYLQELPNRRKALILISEGIPLEVSDLAPRENLSNGNDAAGIMRNVVIELRDAFAAAQRANVNIYTIDPGGLSPDAVTAKLDFLRSIAASTGGFAIVDTNDTPGGVAQIYRENSSYYLLGYPAPSPRRPGTFRRLEVRVNRPGLTVRSRTGYFEAERERPAKAREAPSSLWTALAALLPKGDIAMQVWAGPFAVPGRTEAAVAIVTALRQPAPVGRERIVEQLDLLTTAYDPQGNRRGLQRQQVRVALRPQVASDVAYEVVGRLDLKPGRYELRLAAQSSMQGKAGSVFCDVEVPDFSKDPLSLSGLAVGATPGPVSAPKDAVASLLPLVPTTTRAFAPEDHVVAFARIYQGGRGAPKAVSTTARIVDGRGTTVFDRAATIGADQFSSARTADYRLDLPLTSLRPGPHLLTIEAMAGGRRVQRDVRFVVSNGVGNN